MIAPAKQSPSPVLNVGPAEDLPMQALDERQRYSEILKRTLFSEPGEKTAAIQPAGEQEAGSAAVKNRLQRLPQDIGLYGRVLRALGLLGTIGSSGATGAGSRILDLLERVVEKGDDKDAAFAYVDGDRTFQSILEANPMLKERYRILKGGEAVEVPPVEGSAFEKEVGRLGCFLRFFGITLQRTEQACAVVLSRIQWTEETGSDFDTIQQCAERALTWNENRVFSGTVASNPLFQRRFTNMTVGRDVEVREITFLEQEFENAKSVSAKAAVGLKCRKLNPKDSDVQERRNDLLRGCHGQILTEMFAFYEAVAKKSVSDAEELFDEMRKAAVTNFFTKEDGASNVFFFERRKEIETKFFDKVAAEITALTDESGPEAFLEAERRVKKVWRPESDNYGQFDEKYISFLTTLFQHQEGIGYDDLVKVNGLVERAQKRSPEGPLPQALIELQRGGCFKIAEQGGKGKGTELLVTEACRFLLTFMIEQKDQACGQPVIDAGIDGLFLLVCSTEKLSKPNELWQRLTFLQPDGRNAGECLTIDQNRKVEAAKQYLALSAMDVSRPLSLEQAAKVVFAGYFLRTHDVDTVPFEEKINSACGVLRTSLEGIETVAGDDKPAILRVLLRGQEEGAYVPPSVSDIAILLRNRERLNDLASDEFILESINFAELPPAIPLEDYAQYKQFFELLQAPREAYDGPTPFQLKQQMAESRIQRRAPNAALVQEQSRQEDVGRYTSEELRQLPTVSVPEGLRDVDSTRLIEVRKAELPTAIAMCRFVSREAAAHLIQDQVPIAIGRKSEPASGDGRRPEWPISNPESISALLFTEFGYGEADASVFHQGVVTEYSNGKLRPVIVVRNIHPDAEQPSFLCREGTAPVFLWLAALGEERVEGKAEDALSPPVASDEEKARWNERERRAYDERWLRHYVYHLYPNGVRPAKGDIKAENIFPSVEAANMFLEGLVDGKTEDIIPLIENKYVMVKGRLVSLHAYFMTAVLQTRNIHAGLEAAGPYTYTVMPPSIFSLGRGGPTFHNRLQALAYKFIGPEKFKNLQVIAPNSYGDDDVVDIFEKVFGKEKVLKLSDLYPGGNVDESKIKGALIQETNSDPFADNYNSEKGSGSLEAVVGQHVRAGFSRTNPDRLRYLIQI